MRLHFFYPYHELVQPYLWDAVNICDNFDDVVQRQKRVAFQLRVDVLALGAGSQQLYERVVVGQRSVLVHALALGAHHLQQHGERGAVVVEHQHVFASVHQLHTETKQRPRKGKLTFIYQVINKTAFHSKTFLPHLGHDFVLTFLHILCIFFHNGLQELEVLNVSSVCLDAVDKMMDHAVADLIAQLVVVHKDVTHCLSFKQLVKYRRSDSVSWRKIIYKTGKETDHR